MDNDSIAIVMEYMDLGSLFSVYIKYGPIPELPTSIIAASIIKGLIYLDENHKILHRGIMILYRYQTGKYIIKFSRPC
jgi:serine/threonine protein kinase